MAEVNPVSNTNVLLESMLQKLRLNPQSNGLKSDIQTSGPSVEFNAATGEDLSEANGCPSNNGGEQDRRSSFWNNASPWTHSSPFWDTSTPNSNNPFQKIRKHVFSPKPKRTPLWRGNDNFSPERNNDVTFWDRQQGTPKLENYNQISPEGENRGVPDFKTEPYQRPPDLLTQTLPSRAVLETPEVRGQSGTWSWGVEASSGKTTKTRKKKWGEAKRWAKKVKERWKEKHRGMENEPGDDGELQGMNEEMQSNPSPLYGPIYVNHTRTEHVNNSCKNNEPIYTRKDEAGTSSPTFMSETPFDLSTSNLMEEIFSGTEWAQFLSVNTIQEQSDVSPSALQSGEQEWTGKWKYTDTTKCHWRSTQEQMSLPDSMTQHMAVDEPVYRPHGRSQISLIELTTHLQTSDLCTNHLQSVDLSLNTEDMNEQSLCSQQISKSEDSFPQLSYPQSQVSDLSWKQSQDRKEGFIPVLSYLKPVNSSSSSTQGSFRRKREHWFTRIELSEKEENHRSPFMSAHSSNSNHSISLTSPVNSYRASEASESSLSMETAVKKRRMENPRHVRFADEVIFLPPTIWPAEVEENEKKEEEGKNKEVDQKEEDPAPRSDFPNWIGSLKGFKRTK